MSIHRGYSPTQEYMEMFPWKDGMPFDWDKTKSEGKLDEMFLKGTGTASDGLINIELTRDPRMYEEIIVNGQLLAYGDVVVIDDNFGIRVTEIVGTEELLESLTGNKSEQ